MADKQCPQSHCQRTEVGGVILNLGSHAPWQKENKQNNFNSGTNTVILTKFFKYRHKRWNFVLLKWKKYLRQSIYSHLQPYNVTILFILLKISNMYQVLTHIHTVTQACISFLHRSTFISLSFSSFNSLHIFSTTSHFFDLCTYLCM